MAISKENRQLLYAIGILIIIIVGFIFFKPSPKLFAISIPDLENQLRAEYTTYWDDKTDDADLNQALLTCTLKDDDFYHRIQDRLRQEVKDGIIPYGCVNLYNLGTQPVSYKDTVANIDERVYKYKVLYTPKFFCQFNGDVGGIAVGTSIDINPAGVGTANCESTRVWKGQEVTYVLGGTYHTDCQWGGSSYVCEPYVHLTFKPHTLNPDVYDVYRNGQLVGTQSHPEGIKWGSGARSSRLSDFGATASGITYFIGYKAQFECDLGPNERWIETQWIDSVNVDDVITKDGLIPTKFCKTTRPFVLRDIAQGETAISPDPIPAFNRGETLKSPSSNQLIIVRYATYQVPGLENPTDATQAYRCVQRDSNYKCLKWQVETVIKPVEVVVQCKQNSDCPLPLTQFQDTSCLGYFKGCINNKCEYDNTILDAPKCQNQVVTIVKQTEYVETRSVVPVAGSNSFVFAQNFERTSFNIGDQLFTATQPQFLCQVPSDSDYISAPKPSSDCWQTRITYGDKVLLVKDTQSINVQTEDKTPIIDVQYFAGGTLTRGEYRKPQDWNNNFIFTIHTGDALKLDVEDSGFVIKDTQKKIKLSLLNNLPAGDILIRYQQKIRVTNQNLPIQSKTINAIKGVNDFEIDMNTQNPGINTITIQVFYKIMANSEILIPSDKFTLNYNVVTELPSVEKVVEVTKEVVVPKVETKEIQIERIVEVTKIPLWVWGLFVVAVIIIGYLILSLDI